MRLNWQLVSAILVVVVKKELIAMGKTEKILRNL